MFGGHYYGGGYFGGDILGPQETRAVCAVVNLSPIVSADDLTAAPVLSATSSLEPEVQATLSFIPQSGG
jgi:hypothetical protein